MQSIPNRYNLGLAESERLRNVLVSNLAASKDALASKLKQVSGHWSYEDAVYRFYHGSFKVFHAQNETVEIVHLLASMDPEIKMPDEWQSKEWTSTIKSKLPDFPLNSRFMSIMKSGTGQRFTDKTNANWDQSTRPIIEALFHAKYMLEMAVKYCDVPQTGGLDSGFAALLYLYDLR